MDKIPCIKVNGALFAYIEPYLKKWGYKGFDLIRGNFDVPHLLVINYGGKMGRYSNGVTTRRFSIYTRVLVKDVEEFLSRAAELKGFTYKKENMFTKKDLKSGMVVKTRNNTMFLVVDDKLISTAGFGRLTDYNDDLTVTALVGFDIMEVYDEVNCWGWGFSKGLSYVEEKKWGKLIWKRDETKEITMQEIADKFGIPLKDLRIKDK